MDFQLPRVSSLQGRRGVPRGSTHPKGAAHPVWSEWNGLANGMASGPQVFGFSWVGGRATVPDSVLSLRDGENGRILYSKLCYCIMCYL